MLRGLRGLALCGVFVAIHQVYKTNKPESTTIIIIIIIIIGWLVGITSTQ